MEFVLENKNGTRVTIDSYGCTVKEIIFDGENMISGTPYPASVIGRVAGRLSDAEGFMLHGNHEFDRTEWNGTQLDDSVMLRYISPAGINGFPGNVDVLVTYTLSDEDELRIDYFAETDEATFLNLTNHAYFNLNGPDVATVRNHILAADTEYYLPLNEDLTPAGELKSVSGTVFDLSSGRHLGEVFMSEDSQVAIARNGFDHAFVFGCCKDFDLYTRDKIHTATVMCPDTSRAITMKTDYPCFVCYTGNQMKIPHMGICLEAQLLPDAPNYEEFGSIELLPEKPYSHFVSYRFERK